MSDSVGYTKAILNILDDFTEERSRFQATQRAVLNILDDLMEERSRFQGTQKAILNILDDSAGEKQQLQLTQKAVLNILGDFGDERSRLADVQRALLNILDDFEVEKTRVKKTAAELARSNAELEQFAYVASHDLQEPLRMVSAYVQLLEKRYKAQIDAQADKYIHYAVDGANRMEALIGALLEYSRAGRMQLQSETVDTEGVLEEVTAILKTAIEESHATITRGPLPRVRSDPGQLQRVFQNLVANAVKFRRPDALPLVHVSAEPKDGGWIFSIRDNGIGIDKDYAGRLFVIFQRLHTRSEYPGTGIGLAICKRVVERLGGRIWFESAPGQGTTFFFTLPARYGEAT